MQREAHQAQRRGVGRGSVRMTVSVVGAPRAAVRVAVRGVLGMTVVEALGVARVEALGVARRPLGWPGYVGVAHPIERTALVGTPIRASHHPFG